MSTDSIKPASSEASFPAVSDGEIGGLLVQTVNARDLHAFLGVGKVFAAWISERIEAYSFSEGTDFVVFSDPGKNSKGGRPAKEYALTLDMAKELGMVERNEQGRRVRQYFIECERRAKASGPEALAVLNDPAAMRGLLLTYSEKVLTLEGKVAEMAPQVEALERIAVSDGSLCVTDAAKTLQTRPKDLFTFLRRNGWIYTRAGSSAEIAYQARLIDGSLEHKTTTVLRSDGSEKTVTQVRVTPKGLTKLAKLLPPAVSAA
jgi:anti-repressor protein